MSEQAPVIELGAHVPLEVREAAKAAYLARERCRVAQRDSGRAMRAFSTACKKFAFDPSSLSVGGTTGQALVPWNHHGEPADE